MPNSLDLAINIKAVDNASSALSSLANGIGKNFGNAFGNLKFAMQNIRTEGTLSKDAFLAAGADMGKALAGVAIAATAVGVAIGTKAVQAASEFQTGLTSLSTGAGEAQSNLKMVGDGILDISVKTATSTKQLTDGMYMIESAGYHGSDGLKVLQAAAEGAKVGNADLGTVANGVTTIMTDFANQNISASQATNTLVATVASGKTTMQDLSGALSGVLPTASAAKVGLTDVMSAMATMTGEGVPAANAATYLRQTIQTLSAPSKGVSDALKGIGLSAQQVSDGIKTSLPNTLHMIIEALGKKFPEGSVQYQQALTKIAGGSKQMQGILDLTGSHMATFAQNFGTVDNAVTGTGDKITGFAQVQNTFNFKMDQAKEAVNALMIKLGTALLPVLGRILDTVTPMITGFIAWEGKTHGVENAMNGVVNVIAALVTGIANVIGFFQKNQVAMDALKAVLITIGIMIMAVVVPAFIAWAISAGAAAISTLVLFAPLIALIAVISLVVFGIIEAIQHWGQIVAWLKGVWSAVSSWFMSMLGALGGFFAGIWNGILSGLKAAWNAIVNAVKVGATALLSAILAPFHAVGALFVWLYNHNYYFKALIDAIVNIVKAGLAWLTTQWQNFTAWLGMLWQSIVGIATNVWNTVVNAIKIAWNAVVAVVTAVWQSISNAFSSAWSTYIAGPLGALWRSVSGVFSSAWNNYVAKPLGDLWNSVSKWFSDLGTGAANSGKNFISMLVSGITSGAGAIWNAVTGIAKNIWSALGFHSPAKEGPGKDADKWMPNLVSMLSSGLLAGVPKIQAAVNVVAKPLATLGQPAQAGVSGPVAAPAGGGATIINNYVTINAPALSKREADQLGQAVTDWQSRKQRQSGNNVTWTSGGKQ
jgi:TP901 family phage tail tape measure protein